MEAVFQVVPLDLFQYLALVFHFSCMGGGVHDFQPLIDKVQNAIADPFHMTAFVQQNDRAEEGVDHVERLDQRGDSQGDLVHRAQTVDDQEPVASGT